MRKKIIAVVGAPGSGKTWVCNQLKDKYNYIPHDDYIGKDYVKAIIDRSNYGTTTLIEIPFSITQIKEPLEAEGLDFETVFIIEDEKTLSDRYLKREGKPIPKGHLTRQQTYAARAVEYKSFKGTAEQVLKHLKSKS